MSHTVDVKIQGSEEELVNMLGIINANDGVT